MRAVQGLECLANFIQTTANPVKAAPEPVERRLQSCNSKITDRRQKLAEAKQCATRTAQILQACNERVREFEEALEEFEGELAEITQEIAWPKGPAPAGHDGDRMGNRAEGPNPDADVDMGDPKPKPNPRGSIWSDPQWYAWNQRISACPGKPYDAEAFSLGGPACPGHWVRNPYATPAKQAAYQEHDLDADVDTCRPEPKLQGSVWSHSQWCAWKSANSACPGKEVAAAAFNLGSTERPTPAIPASFGAPIKRTSGGFTQTHNPPANSIPVPDRGELEVDGDGGI